MKPHGVAGGAVEAHAGGDSLRPGSIADHPPPDWHVRGPDDAGEECRQCNVPIGSDAREREGEDGERDQRREPERAIEQNSRGQAIGEGADDGAEHGERQHPQDDEKRHQHRRPRRLDGEDADHQQLQPAGAHAEEADEPKAQIEAVAQKLGQPARQDHRWRLALGGRVEGTESRSVARSGMERSAPRTPAPRHYDTNRDRWGDSGLAGAVWRQPCTVSVDFIEATLTVHGLTWMEWARWPTLRSATSTMA